MSRLPWRALALAWSLLGLAALWGWTEVRSRQGTEWLVPVAGYDPRDLLRGHYVLFQYDWPGLAPAQRDRDGIGELCLHGRPPVIDRVTLVPAGAGRSPECANYARADDLGSYVPTGLQTGRLYVSQEAGPGLEKQLRDPRLQALVRVRLRDDGHLTPLSLSFRPRPAEAAAGE
jgi:hypothetical protein